MNGPEDRRELVVPLPATRHVGGHAEARVDEVAVEEPLELRLVTPDGALPLAVLMRTPGREADLLRGWLLSEALLPADARLVPDPEYPNVWRLHTAEVARLRAGARLTVSSSACGVCGTGSIERLALRVPPPAWTGGPLSPATLAGLPARLLAAQAGYAASGGLHAAGLFSGDDLLFAAEDVGRHNAVDKVIGAAWLAGRDAGDLTLVVSSRAGFEIVQKAVAAGLAVVVSVGAASSLAVETAQSFGVTLCAFVREGRLTVYSGGERVLGGESRP